MELDGYCEPLGIAFEHHGEQHYRPIEYFNKNKTFQYIIENDQKKSLICKDRCVKLIIIPALFKITKLNDLKEIIFKQCSDLDIKINTPNINIDLNQLYANNFEKDFLEKASAIAFNKNGKLLSNRYLNAKQKMEWECSSFHCFNATYDKVARGAWCPICINLDRKIVIPLNILKKLYIDRRLTISEISNTLNYSMKIISNELERHKLRSKVRHDNLISKEKLIQSFCVDRKSISQISREEKISHKSINKYLKKFGLK